MKAVFNININVLMFPLYSVIVTYKFKCQINRFVKLDIRNSKTQKLFKKINCKTKLFSNNQ